MSGTKTCRRLFILGAGFSKAAGMPLATELTDMLLDAAIDEDDEEKNAWVKYLRERLQWMQGGGASINVEELFHYAAFDAERWKMAQHMCPVGRGDGPATPYNYAEMVDHVLASMTESLASVILQVQQSKECNREPIERLARLLNCDDVVMTFNYDTLVEQALDSCGVPWQYGLADVTDDSPAVTLLKMHGSVNWVLLQRDAGNRKLLTLLYSKKDENTQHGSEPSDEEHEYHWELWRINEERHVESEIERREGLNSYVSFPGMASLGSHKPLNLLPGSGLVWARAGQALVEADEIYIAGFSLSPFDAMSRLLFAEAMMLRHGRDHLPRAVRLIDPNAEHLRPNYASVFQTPIVVDERCSQDVDWSELLT